MERVKGDVRDGVRRDTAPAEAANEPVIEGSGPPAAWDPFEVWRTRVRDVQQERAKVPHPPKED